MTFRNILPVVLAIFAFSSCAVYRAGQTPDDVYYSPGPTDESYASNNRGSDNGESYYTPEDNYLRMKARDPQRWSAIDDYSGMNSWGYGGYYGTPGYSMYSPYSYGGYGYGMYSGLYGYSGMYGYYNPWSYGSYYSNYYYWNSYYNPYCGGMIVGSYKSNPVVYNTVRSFSSAAYRNTNYSRSNVNNGGRAYQPANGGRYSTSNTYYNNSNSGGLRRVYSNSGSSSSNSGSYTPSSPTRSYNPSYSPSSSGSSGARMGGGSSGGGGGSASRPSRGH